MGGLRMRVTITQKPPKADRSIVRHASYVHFPEDHASSQADGGGLRTQSPSYFPTLEPNGV